MDLYAPLNTARREIRLVTLVSGSFTEDIHCKFSTVTLDEPPHYEALSYVWGDSKNARQIYLNGHIWNATANLECALRHLRRDNGKPRTLWVDALCINQHHIPERDQQVGIMRGIYESAADVLIWLGEWEPSSNQGDQALLDAFDVIEQLAAGQHLHDISFFRSSEKAIRCARPEVLSMIISLMDRPWWNRAWVVQETVVSSHATLVCGNVMTEWDNVIRAGWNVSKHLNSLCCGEHYLALPGDMRTVVYNLARELRLFYNVRHRFQHPDEPQLSLWELLVMFRSKQSTDPRDKIYSFLGMVTSWPKGTPLVPSYALTTSQVYMRATLKVITDMESLVVLTDCVGKRSSPELPSWVPDWTAQGQGEANLECVCVATALYNASASQPVQATLFGDCILGLMGMKVDTVMKSNRVESGLRETLRKWWHIAEASWNALGEPSRPYPSGGSWQDAFSRTVLGDLITPIGEIPVVDGKSGAWRRAQQDDIEVLRAYLSELDLSPPDQSDFFTEAGQTGKEVMLTISRIFSERLGYFITPKGYMGLGPDDVCEGDEVWVLMGSPVPFILRPLRYDEEEPGEIEPTRLHRLVGYCLVHGIMDGECTVNSLHDAELVGLV